MTGQAGTAEVSPLPDRGDPGGAGVVIRAPNHLGDVVMALGAIRDRGGDVVVVSSLVPLLAMAGIPGRIIPFRRGAGGWFEVMDELRRGRYRRGILLSGSFSAALLFRAGGVRELRGMSGDGRDFLLSDPVPRTAIVGNHRVDNLRLLAGLPPLDRLRPHPLTPPEDAVVEWRRRLAPEGAPLVGLFPGSNAPARRWDVSRFDALARALVERGARVVVLGAPGERHLTEAAAGATSGVTDLGGQTDLSGLAAVLSLCTLFVTNDTGPMHLAAAVGTPTLTLWGSSDPGEVHPLGSRDEQVRGERLPCAPCKKNVCPRSGAGTLLASARNECMNLIEIPQVLAAAERLLP